jgi:hypothetical protein
VFDGAVDDGEAVEAGHGDLAGLLTLSVGHLSRSGIRRPRCPDAAIGWSTGRLRRRLPIETMKSTGC